MASVVWQKEDQKEWLSRYFDTHIAEMSEDEVRVFAEWCVQKLMSMMSLRMLKEWREKLENGES